MFPTKAIAGWQSTTDYGRCQLVASYFSAVQGFTQAEILTKVELPKQGSGAAAGGGFSLQQALDALMSRLMGAGSDPFHAVVAYRNFRPDY